MKGGEGAVTPKARGRADVIIAKERNGPVGSVGLTFIDEYARFESPA